MLISEREHREITVKILNKDYPEIACQIRHKILASLSGDKKLRDLSLMPFIVDEFKKFFDVSQTDTWLNRAGRENITEQRELLVASVALVYCPARMMDLDQRVRNGVMAELCRLTGCPRRTMSPSLTNAVVAYKVYKGFRQKVDDFHRHLVESGIFNNAPCALRE